MQQKKFYCILVYLLKGKTQAINNRINKRKFIYQPKTTYLRTKAILYFPCYF